MRPNGESTTTTSLARLDRALLPNSSPRPSRSRRGGSCRSARRACPCRRRRAGVAHLVGTEAHERHRAADEPDAVPAARSPRGTPGSGPLPSSSRTLTLSRSCMPMIGKYSGSATSFAPCSAAISIRRPASFRLASTCGPEAICTAASASRRAGGAERPRRAQRSRRATRCTCAHGMTSILIGAPAADRCAARCARVSIASAPSQERSSSACNAVPARPRDG